WQHVALTLGGSTATMYIDGAIVGTNNAVDIHPQDIPSTQNWLGRSHVTSDPRFHGAYDDFRFYNRALTTNEISSLAGGNDPGTTGLLFGYAFDETDGFTAKDFSGHGKTATLFGGVTWVTGVAGKALSCDGSHGYVTMPADIFSGVGDFT